jgi:hypothetical protein
MPFFIPFLIKGAAIAIKAIIAEKKVAVVAKGLTMATHTYGTATVVATTSTVLMTIGGISWTLERCENAKDCYNKWEQGDINGAVKSMSTLCSKLIAIQSNPQTIIHSTGELLKMNGFESGKVLSFIRDLCDSIDEIKHEIKK